MTGFGLRPNLRLPVDLPQMGLHFVFDTNQDGLRGPVVGTKRPNELRVLVLGDSFSYGIGVRYAETFSALLQHQLEKALGRPVTVVDAGVPAFGTAQEPAFFRNHAAAMEPDLVVLAWYANDLDDNVTKLRMVDGR